jgi:hypothetical protein
VVGASSIEAAKDLFGLRLGICDAEIGVLEVSTKLSLQQSRPTASLSPRVTPDFVHRCSALIPQRCKLFENV